jgi:hypothetical protein
MIGNRHWRGGAEEQSGDAVPGMQHKSLSPATSPIKFTASKNALCLDQDSLGAVLSHLLPDPSTTKFTKGRNQNHRSGGRDLER